MSRRPHPHSPQGGQAIAEFLVAAVLLLVPLFLAVAAPGIEVGKIAVDVVPADRLR